MSIQDPTILPVAQLSCGVGEVEVERKGIDIHKDEQ